MAIVWQKTVGDMHYEVRNAGRSLRLYTNGVFHTQYNPSKPLTGHVWDLLMLPAFFNNSQDIKRILVLGVGGGAVIHLFRHFLPEADIVGIELDQQHIFIAKKIFHLKHKKIKLYQANAIDWIRSYQGEKFDLIVDDLFMEINGEPAPVVKANTLWFSCLLKHLKSQGILIKNFIDQKDIKNCAALGSKKINLQFQSIFQFTTKFNENFVLAFMKQSGSSKQLRDNIKRIKGLNIDLKTCRLRYRIRKLK